MAFPPFAFIPMLPHYRDFWDLDYPRRIMDQDFGLGLFDRDLLPPVCYRGYLLRPRTKDNILSSGSSEVVKDKDKFQVMLDMKQFRPEEISVKTADNCIFIYGKHGEKEDEHGFISRQFTRVYMLPDDVKPETVTSSLSPDGVLTISAPRIVFEPSERVVPVTFQQPASVESPQTEVTLQQPAAVESPQTEVTLQQPAAVESPQTEVTLQQQEAVESPQTEVTLQQPAAVESPQTEVILQQPAAVESPQTEVTLQQPAAVESPQTEVTLQQPAAVESPQTEVTLCYFM